MISIQKHIFKEIQEYNNTRLLLYLIKQGLADLILK
jgi:hypothetical protein